MAQFSVLQTRLGEYLNEATAAQWTAIERKAWLNAAKNDVAVELIDIDNSYLLASPSLTATVAGTAEYSLPTGYVRIRKVERNDTTPPMPLLKIDYDRRWLYDNNERLQITGSNPVYYIAGEKIGLIPTPTTSTANFIRIHYNALPADMSGDTDTTGLPTILDEVIVLGAAVRAFSRFSGDADNTQYQKFERMYQEDKAQKFKLLAHRVAGNRTVRVTDTW